MKGQITIICDDAGTHLTNTVMDASKTDTIFLVHALGKMLGLEYMDYQIIALADATDVLDDAKVQKNMVTVDVTEFMKQLSEEQDES